MPREIKKVEIESNEGDATDMGVAKLTKAEKRAKLKKSRKEAKKQAKEEVQQTSQADVLVCILMYSLFDWITLMTSM